MNKKELLEEVKQWLNNAPKNANFGIVTDIQSIDNVIQLFY